MENELDLNIIKYKILSLEDLKAATNLQIKSSMQECLSIGFGLTDEPEGTDREGFNELLKNIVEDGLSIGAFDRTTNEIVGVCFNKLHTKAERDCVAPLEESVKENMKNPATLDLMNFIFQIESSVDLYDHYGVEIALELFYIGVNERYRRYGIARNLVQSTVDMVQALALDRPSKTPEIIYGVFTSNYSQALAKKFHFEFISTVKYDDYVCRDGKRVSERLGKVHQAAALGVRRF